VMILGYGIIAVPTGIVTLELSEATRRATTTTHTCPECSAEGHLPEAVYCWRCAAHLEHAPKVPETHTELGEGL
jgi:voltage-gated potassium channel